MVRRRSVRQAIVFWTALFCMSVMPAASLAQDIAMTDAPRARYIDPPPGFRVACGRYAWLCTDSAGARLSEERMLRLARAVNREVNHAIRQVSDLENYGVAENWTLPRRGRGDCEDLALEKMLRLLRHDVPAARLSMAVVLDRHGENHAVLLLRVNGGYLVLDSLTDRMLGPGRTGYHMLAMQASEDRARWRVVDDSSLTYAGASATLPAPESDTGSFTPAGTLAPDR